MSVPSTNIMTTSSELRNIPVIAEPAAQFVSQRLAIAVSANTDATMKEKAFKRFAPDVLPSITTGGELPQYLTITGANEPCRYGPKLSFHLR